MFTPNRVAAIGSFCVSLGAVIAAFVGVFPTGTQNTILAAAGILAHAPAVVTYLLGSQKSEANQVQLQQARIYAAAPTTPEVQPFLGIPEDPDAPDQEQWLNTRQEIAESIPAEDPIK